MALSSTSTPEQIIAQYADNAGYAFPASVAKAWLFVEACRLLALKLPRGGGAQGGGGGVTMELSVDLVAQERARAEEWIRTHPEAGDGGAEAQQVRFFNFDGLRT